MAHRGRLNVLANIMRKPASQIFAEFQDKVDPSDDRRAAATSSTTSATRSIACSATRDGDAQRVHLSLAFNPSHLEWVNTVVQGRVRAKQDRIGDTGRTRCLPMLIHGDAAFAGQGIVAEALNMSELDGYRVGGTVHIVINNQVGFTTSPQDAKSTHLRTDVARMLQIPIFHVNGEDPEAVCQVVDLAVDFRQRFHRDVLIELWCYRKLGHNEGDEPSYTQPVDVPRDRQQAFHPDGVPGARRRQPSPDGEAAITVEETDAIAAAKRQELEAELAVAAKAAGAAAPEHVRGRLGRGARAVRTPGAGRADRRLAGRSSQRSRRRSPRCRPGSSCTPSSRASSSRGGRRWAPARNPSTGGWARRSPSGRCWPKGCGCACPGRTRVAGPSATGIRCSFDYNDGARVHAARAPAGQAGRCSRCGTARCRRAGVLGFEYGYSLDMPDGLTIWEAQFGDFVNAAQVIIDQFLVSSEAKWNRVSGLVHAAAARHGGAGAGALERASRAVPQPWRERQHAGLQPHHAGAVLPRAAAAGAAPLPQAARHHVAEEPAAHRRRRPRR